VHTSRARRARCEQGRTAGRGDAGTTADRWGAMMQGGAVVAAGCGRERERAGRQARAAQCRAA
jgi:hypothetical protein